MRKYSAEWLNTLLIVAVMPGQPRKVGTWAGRAADGERHGEVYTKLICFDCDAQISRKFHYMPA